MDVQSAADRFRGLPHLDVPFDVVVDALPRQRRRRVGYWGTLPLGILVSVLLAGASSRSYIVAR